MHCAKDTHEDHDTSTENADESNHDPQFEPIVSLPEQEIKMLGGPDEEELLKIDVKLLKHKEKGTIRLLMQRDKTLKICANHYFTLMMELKPNVGSDHAWVWNTHANFANKCPKPELLAICFLNVENAQKFKTKEKKGSGKNNHAEKGAEELKALSMEEDTKEDTEGEQL
uniref:RanBD1 domain-containing protein n=1 Tax=Colobus angolensis palliatus TaxID=336983 RepID=A0A2K5HTR6_COLAP